ncbi:hypothetical protein AXG93_3167s1000 [Marchantia polymorpha subsp. ruderalis]|uniref:Uncharacterized protein n=1 Tax=Marchantia polymorpha subsp. ruderalis TaxID=1480154 RepID=A0A176WNM2_MARPO|nr:hypothetical protein AXG93_3167s1000 [Marchantia polymorpha subsp. ruderalis]
MQVGDHLTVDDDVARGWRQKTGNRVQQRGLTAAGRADQDEKAALFQLDIDTLEDLDTADLLADLFDLEKAHCDDGDDDDRPRAWQQDAPEDLEETGTIDHRGLHQLVREGFVIIAEKQRGEAETVDDMHHDEAGGGIRQAHQAQEPSPQAFNQAAIDGSVGSASMSPPRISSSDLNDVDSIT